MKKTIMTRFAAILLLAFTFASTYAQTTNKHLFAGLSLGAAFPAGNFANKKANTDITSTSMTGLAKTGIAARITAGYALKKTWGVLFTLGAHMNKQDATSQEQVSGTASGTATSIYTNSWKVYAIMTGVYYNLPHFTKAAGSFQIRLSAGACKTTIPAYSGTVKNNGMIIGAYTYGRVPLPWSFCYQAGAAWHLQINKALFLLVNADYFGATAYHKVTYYPNFPSTNNSMRLSKKYPLNTINTEIGVGIRF